MSERSTWDEARLAMARVIAKRSLCSRDQVGAVIVDTRNRIIGEGYNGPPAGFRHDNQSCTEWCARSSMSAQGLIPPGQSSPGYDDCPSIHAEANALLMSDRTARLNGTIYVTSFPCTGCLKLISNSGLRHIYIGVDGKHEYRYREDDYETVRLLGFRITFEDDRSFTKWLSAPGGFIAEDGTKWSTENAQNWCAPSTTKD
jgi:dCMP deaminase